jgi:protein-tyrosine phosphatase
MSARQLTAAALRWPTVGYVSTDSQYADLASHHIEGYARAAVEAGRPAAFSVPLVSHIRGNLWTGGCRHGVRLPDDFGYVISLYPSERYALGHHTRLFQHTLYDSADLPDPEELRGIAAEVNACVSLGKTLVHCQAGLNRSGLVAGLALVLDGMTPADAIALLRERRSPAVLCNETFETWLLAQG